MTSVMIATPAYGGQVTEKYMQSVMALIFEAQRQGLNVGVFTQTGESLITRARNNMFQTFIDHPEYDQLLWIDADIGFEPLNVLRLVHSEHEVSAAPYPLKTVNWDSVRGDTPDEKQSTGRSWVVNQVSDEVDGTGFTEVLDAGTGFMCIKRSVIQKLQEAYPDDYYESDDHNVPEGERKRWLFFDTMLEETEQGKRYLSEDYAFCRKWQKIGGKVMLDVGGPALRHYGGYAY